MAMRFKIRLVQPCVAGVILSLAVALAPRPAFGEGQKTTNTTSTGVITPNSNLPTGFQPTPQFVNGKVALDDGTLPPAGVPIERVCAGIVHTEGRSDQKGGFGFELGHEDLVQ